MPALAFDDEDRFSYAVQGVIRLDFIGCVVDLLVHDLRLMPLSAAGTDLKQWCMLPCCCRWTSFA